MWAYPLRNAKKANKAKIPYDNHAKPLRKNKKTKKAKYLGVCRWEARFATSAAVHRRIQMWAYPLRNAKKTHKAKIPYDNHAKPLRTNRNTQTTKYLDYVGGSLDLALPREILFCWLLAYDFFEGISLDLSLLHEI